MKQFKFNRTLPSSIYFLSFDLAKKLTGWSLTHVNMNDDNANFKFIDGGLINSNNFDNDSFYTSLYTAFTDVITKANDVSKRDGVPLIIIKERLPNQNGPHSTIATLQGLASVHAIFDYAVEQSGINYYDKDGVHSTSVKSVFKKLARLDANSTIDKCDIKNIINKMVENSNIVDTNISDSLAVVITLIFHKWNADIDEGLKELRKYKKKFKSDAKQKEIDNKMQIISMMRIKEYL